MPRIGKGFFDHQGILIAILVIFSLAVLFINLGQRSFWEPDEGRYAEISREMVESGDWLTPRLNYIKHFDKPPMAYWLIGSSFRLFGLNEFSGHLPLVLVGLAGVLATFLLGKGLFGQRTGFLSAIILISSLGYPALARVLSTDIIFSFFCLLCYLLFARKQYLLLFLALALGFMTKGPAIFVIVLIPISAFFLLTKQTSSFKQIPWAGGLALFAALALPWYIYQVLLNKGLLHDWVLQHTLNRIVRDTKQPFYFFIPVLAGLFFPWIFFLIPALTKNLRLHNAAKDKRGLKILLLVFWFGLPFIFFSSIGKKLVPYILPLLAPLAVITARFWDQLIDNPRMLATRLFAACFYVFLSCLGLMALGTIVFLVLGLDHQLGVEAARLNIITLPVILIGGIIASLSYFRSQKTLRLFWTIALTGALFFLNAIAILPKVGIIANKSIKHLALTISKDLRPEDKVVNYRCFLKSLPFYLQRRTIVVERQRHTAYEQDPQQWQDYLLQDKQDMYRLLLSQDTKVFCITYTWEYDKIKQEFDQPLYFLGRAGKYVLFANKK